MKKPVQWTYGIITVPQRHKTRLFHRTLQSLAAAGFDRPRLFVDGIESPGVYSQFGLDITVRYPSISTTGNWVLAAWELYLRKPDSNRFALFQDDLVICRNTKQYLERCSHPEHSYLNLCTYPENEELAEGRTGWYLSNQKGRGAQALVFDRDAMMTLLCQRHLVDRMQDLRRGPHAVDGAVCNSLHGAGYREYVHYPSLVFHTGEQSTIGHRPQPEAMSFPGEGYDPNTLLADS